MAAWDRATITDWRDRVKIDREDLAEKIQRVSSFLDTKKKFDKVSDEQVRLLEEQLTIMRDYIAILDKRLK